jgi:hypothetical protein
MATYKVPQDVEADDKLIGFLSLKQFIFVILGLGFGYLTFFFFTKIHPIASVIWFPPMVICLVLGLYQRRDQPVEVYLASAIRFRLKPHARIWDQEGYEERVIITAPPKIEKHYTKGYSRDQVSSRLGNLSRLMDTRGWASKMANDWQNPDLEASANSERLMQPQELATATTQPIYAQPVDIQDENTSMVARDFEAKIQQSENETHQKAILALQQARQTATNEPVSANTVSYTKYPEMHQKTIQPVQQVQTPQQVAPAQQSLPQPLQQTQIEPITAAASSSAIPQPAPADDHTLSGDEVEIKLH